MSAYEMFADLKADMRALKTAVAPRKAQVRMLLALLLRLCCSSSD